MRERVFLAGIGGQGVDSAGSILAHMVLHQGFEVCNVSQYSPEVRGGWVSATVIIADGEVGSPIVGSADSLLLFSGRSVAHELHRAVPDGLIVVNSSLTGRVAAGHTRVIEVPATAIAAELGNEQVMNMVMLGAYVEVRGVLDPAGFQEALEAVLPARHHGHIPLNLKAVELGAQHVEQRRA